MGDGNRPAMGNLLTEKGHHRSGRPDYIPKTDTHHDRIVSAVIGLHQQLTHALTRPHHVGRSDRLVRRNHDKTVDTVRHGRLHDIPAPDDIVKYRFPWIPLHHGDVLVGRRMDNNIGSVLPDNQINNRFILHIYQHRDVMAESQPVPQIHLDGIEINFGIINHDEGFGVKSYNLAAKFRAD